MYYAHFILNKKGPLAKIWLAAHWDKKLTKAQIYETNIESTIETILEPQMKLALRTSGHLLLGVCRIYSRKVKYLLADCNEAFVKIKLAFRPGLIDLPKEKQQAQAEAITLPEKFPEFSMLVDINMEDMDFGETASSTMQLNLHHQQARIEDITLKEDFGGATFVAPQDDDFGDMGSFGMGGMDMDTFMMSDMERGRRVGNSMGGNEQDVDFFDDNSAFGANQIDNDSNAVKNNDLNADLNTDHRTDVTNADIPNRIDDFSSHLENPENNLEDETMMQTTNDDMGGGGGGDDNNDMIGLTTTTPNVVPTLFDDQPTVLNNNTDATKKTDDETKVNEDDVGSEVSDLLKDANAPPATTTIATTTTATAAVEKQIRAKRRRKLIIDDVKEIDSATMKAQLSDTTGILGSLELAPPTRQLMYMKENGVVEKLFSMTSRPLSSKLLQKLYTRNMTTKSLIDITNNSKQPTKPTAPITNTVTNIVMNNSNINNNDISTARDNYEPSMNNNNQTKGELPLVDSYIDDHSKRVTINETDINIDPQNGNGPIANDLDEFDQFGGPASIFNQGDNLDLLLDDYPNQINLEVTPSKLNATDKTKKADETTTAVAEVASDDSDDGDEDETNKKANKTTSPHRKRSYKRSTLNQSNKENKDDGDEDGDETLTATDPTKNLNKRAKTLVTLLNNKFAKTENVGFFDLIKRNGKKSVVQKFYSLLVLKKYDIIEVFQEETYGDIILTKGEKFENFVS